MRVRVLRSAHVSILEGYDFYEAQQSGLGLHFLTSILSDIHSLRVSGGSHQIVRGSYRRKVCKRFPFSIYYKVEHAEISIYLVVDNRRDPGWIRERLS